MKSLFFFLGIGALLMGIVAPGDCRAGEKHVDTFFAVSAAQLLAEKMHKEGIRKAVSLTDRHDLEDIVIQAENRAQNIDLGCQLNTTFEVRLQPQGEPQFSWVAGYEAYLTCDDAPSPGLALYYDVDHQYLAEFANGT